MTLVAGKLRHLFFTGDNNGLFVTRSLKRYVEDNRAALIVCSGKSEAKVTIVKPALEVLHC